MDHMQERNWTLTQLAQKSCIHISELSRILNHKQSLSLRKLDAISEAFGFKEGTLYTYYIQECFNEKGFLDKRRSNPFIYKCASDGYDEQLQILLESVLDERSKSILTKNLNLIFSVAEKLFEDGKERQALPLYEVIIESMPNHFSQQVSISYFRKYYLVRLTEEGPYAEAYVLKHVTYMSREFQLLTYFWVTATYYHRQQWDKVLYYSKILEGLAKEGEFYGRALLYQGFALKRIGGSLKEVLDIIDRYAKVNDYYTDIAVGNRFLTLLDYGKFEYVDSYLNWIEGRDDVFAGLPRILEIYVSQKRFEDAERLVNRFQHIFEELSISNVPFRQHMYLHFRFANALYFCESNQTSKGLHELLDVAYQANKLGVMKRFKQCLQIYWNYKNHIDFEHERKYMQLLG